MQYKDFVVGQKYITLNQGVIAECLFAEDQVVVVRKNKEICVVKYPDLYSPYVEKK